MHQQPSIASIILLLARFIGADLRRVPNPTFDSELFHQLQEPLRCTTSFNPNSHRTWQPGVKLAHFIALVSENVLFYFSCFRVQHRQGLRRACKSQPCILFASARSLRSVVVGEEIGFRREADRSLKALSFRSLDYR